jgi:hypothetical protein
MKKRQQAQGLYHARMIGVLVHGVARNNNNQPSTTVFFHLFVDFYHQQLEQHQYKKKNDNQTTRISKQHTASNDEFQCLRKNPSPPLLRFDTFSSSGWSNSG